VAGPSTGNITPRRGSYQKAENFFKIGSQFAFILFLAAEFEEFHQPLMIFQIDQIS
jgi:hypothetical protein